MTSILLSLASSYHPVPRMLAVRTFILRMGQERDGNAIGQ